MILISHRGNLDGRQINMENNPVYVMEAISKGFNVEVDVWVQNDRFFLGHDSPNYEVTESFLENDKIWCHAKNIESLSKMKKNKNIHFFWHQNDDYTITSNGFFWSYPGKFTNEDCIIVLPETINYEFNRKVHGICSDFISKFI